MKTIDILLLTLLMVLVAGALIYLRISGRRLNLVALLHHKELPNLLSTLRILMVPPILILIWKANATGDLNWNLIALGIFTLASLTDHLDDAGLIVHEEHQALRGAHRSTCSRRTDDKREQDTKDERLNDPADNAHPDRAPGTRVVQRLPHGDHHRDQHPDTRHERDNH